MIEPYRVVTAAEMRALEQAAMAQGITEAQLQERAGREVAEVVAAEIGTPSARLAVALVGPGNNGRDAMVALRHLARWGYPAALYLSPRHAVAADERVELERLGVTTLEHNAAALGRLADMLRDAAAAIDGLLGIGVRGPMRPPLSEIAETLNAARRQAGSRLRVVSVDLPSGLDSDSGQTPGVVVQADVTVALGAVKAGTLRFPGAERVGRLEPRPIGLPPGLVDRLPTRLLDARHSATLLPPRPLGAHKGTFGSLLVVGGSRQYVGAPILAALAAARVGCGIVGLAVPRHVQTSAAARLPEATYVLLPGDGAESHPEESVRSVLEAAARFDALVLGPGLGRSAGAAQLVRELLGGGWPSDKPVVVDADALTLLAAWPEWWDKTACQLMLTPHAGEMSRLTGEPIEAIAQANWECARQWAGRWRQAVTLKSAHTTVAHPDGTAWVSPWANPALATAGSGDVLAGLMAGLIVQGVDRLPAAVLAVTLQALAAQSVQEERGWSTLLASDLADEVPTTLVELARRAPGRGGDGQHTQQGDVTR